LKLELNVDGQPLEGDFDFNGGEARLVRGGEAVEARVSEPEPGLFTVIIGSRVFRCAPETSPSGGAEIVVNGRRVAVAVRDPKRARRGAGSDAAGGGRATLVAPMPGKVVRVMCSQGDEVGAGRAARRIGLNDGGLKAR
jgi:biotin carboxyl carrier protein